MYIKEMLPQIKDQELLARVVYSSLDILKFNPELEPAEAFKMSCDSWQVELVEPLEK